jgi:ferredoxin
MPKITAQGKSFDVPYEANLREALLEHDVDLYNGAAKVLNCHGHSSCGSCLVKVEGMVSAPTEFEKLRMAIPPHSQHHDRRLACQAKVLGDVNVTKFDGHFGTGDDIAWTAEQDLTTIAAVGRS